MRPRRSAPGAGSARYAWRRETSRSGRPWRFRPSRSWGAGGRRAAVRARCRRRAPSPAPASPPRRPGRWKTRIRTCCPASRCPPARRRPCTPRGSPKRALGEEVEVAAVARKAVHAHHDMRIVVIAPLGVGDAVEAVVAQGKEVFLAHGKILIDIFAVQKKIYSAIRLTESKVLARGGVPWKKDRSAPS